MEGVVKLDTLEFYRGKRIFITGHTGFKGSWLCAILLSSGAKITGFSLPPENGKNLFTLAGLGTKMTSVFGDIRDLPSLQTAFDNSNPQIVFHLAAQPLVRESYKNPVNTYHTNVMGTVHILECVRQSKCVQSFLNITTDKVYQNNNWHWGYREDDPLNGFDPYSNSKSCSELVTDSYRNSFFVDSSVAISTARAGNVIGGGDFSKDRIIPDCVRAAMNGSPIFLRNPNSVRPYQHVLDPLNAYLLIAKQQYENPKLSGCYNVGPESCDCISTRALVDLFCQEWGDGLSWKSEKYHGPHEDVVLKLDCSKIHSVLDWYPQWNIKRAMAETVVWTKKWLSGISPFKCMEDQIQVFFR